MKRAMFALAALVVGAAFAAEPVTPAALLDFSSAGYAGGGVPLPRVPAKFAVESTGRDDTATIQAAIDAVAKLPLDAQGFRGAVLLRGKFRVEGQLKIETAGIVLRGEDGVITATGESRRTLIDVRGKTPRTVGPALKVTDETVPAGAKTLTVASVAGLAPGTRVLVRRPSTREWIEAIKANDYPVPGQYRDARLDWIPGSRDIEWERTLTAVDAATNKVTLDAPITTALEAKFGGATVHVTTWPDRVRHVGIEDLICISPGHLLSLDEEHAWIAVAIENAEDAWVRNVSARQFVCSAVWIGHDARAITVTDCSNLHPLSEQGAWRGTSFYVGGQQVLVQGCTTEDGGRDFVAGHCAAGPNVFLECRSVRSGADSGPYESWASGALYDRVSIHGAALAFANVRERVQGAAWTAANCVAWNCASAGKIVNDDPPGAPNRVVVDEKVPSLYVAQLAARGLQVERGVPAARERNVPLAPRPSAPGTARSTHPVSFSGGYLVVDGRALFGGSQNSALWKGQLIQGRARDVGMSPTRWAPGRFGPGLTEDLDALTDNMRASRTPFVYAFPGLWYDRRRDEHSIARRDDGEVTAPFFESPWARSGQGKAWDGLSKYDLTKFNPWYFSRLRELADRCAEKGLVFVYQAYDNHNLQEAAAHWAEFAWRPANNVNDVGLPEPPQWENAGQNRHHIADQFYDVHHAARRALHELYINHILDVLGDSPNFVLTLGYQFAGPLPFQQFFLDTVAKWEQAHGKRVRIQLQTSKAVTDAILADPVRGAHVDVIDTRYWQYLADGKLFAPDGEGKLAFRELRTNAFGRDAVMPTKAEFVYQLVREYRDKFPDKAVLAGQGGFGPIPVLMAGGASPVNAEGGAFGAGGPRDDVAFARFVSEKIADALPRMRPVDGFATNAWTLADAKRDAVLIYSASGATIEVTSTLAGEGTWFNPRDGKTQPAKLDDGKMVTKPGAEAWVLLVRR